MSTTTSHHLSPAFPGRAPWGTASKLRAWQQAAMELYLQKQPRDFLAVATPGAGKTTFALTLASWLLHHHVVQQVTVVAPTEHLKKQWAEAAARIGIRLDPEYSAGPVGREYHGVAVTYAGVGVRPMLHRNRCEQRKTLVILDEIHHAGDTRSWGEACFEAFDPATRRLALTGTPFRSDTNPIPFVSYAEDGEGIRRSVADYTYGYGSALADGVVRPVIFLSYSGNMRWRTKAGDEIEAKLGEPMTKDAISQAWRTALDARGEWMPSVLRAADRRLTEVRKAIPDAGALVIAADQDSARAYAKLIREITGRAATVVLSDDPGASKRIEEFSDSDDRWMVAVRMVSEGVDVPRLAVGVYATTISTPLFFAQAVGRFVRSRRRGETASVFLPTIPMLLGFAHEMEVERDHVLDKPKKGGDDDPYAEEADLLKEAERQQDEDTGEQDQLPFEALESDAVFDRVMYDGAEFGMQAHPGSEEEQDYLGIPGLLEPDQVQMLLQKRQAKQIAHSRKRPDAEADLPEIPAERRPVVTHKELLELRRQLNTMVGAYVHQSGKPHGVIHTELRRVCGGPPAAEATAGQLRQRIAKVQEWATRMR
ncbi:DEAD/DEAH box helicase [Streptomyces alkaliterrae]|uniref:AAA family ATPase n=1 Tax=Streptomyces alkaliterrae TaxID=2213162 RepID=A0A5P0YV24_9ACTN|nr:DEAD/DEAH box helicase [Streptomyces alkaliterrae]MBB1255714.1 DEAD/DEAH box helicase [Streptomyces alkaliterrae]MBB1261406.1 DEAD/DEAH box helicase [Streptomyces alkaliterrae]MQS04143.1 AAA family ATPase [Streptomyces alkaliterrae]